MLVPTLAAFVLGEMDATVIYGSSALRTAGTGAILQKILPNFELELKEALILAAITFPLCSLISAVPIALSSGMPLLDAYFECVSSLTTTGLSLPHLFLQDSFSLHAPGCNGFGGIGLIVLVIGILIRPGTTAFRLYRVNLGESRVRPMCMGGSIGSTTGGIKLLRLILIVQLIRLVFYRFFLLREAVTPLKVKAQVVDPEEVYRIMTYVLLYSVVLIISASFSCFMVLTQQMLFLRLQALWLHSRAVNRCDRTRNAVPAQIVLCADMLLGRVEIIPLFILLLSRIWFERNRKNDFILTQENPRLEKGDELLIITRSEQSISRVYEKL